MKNKVLKILTIITILAILAIIPITIFAYDGIDTDISIGNTNSAKSSRVVTGKILGAVQVIGSIVSIVALVIIGIRYMISSIEEKAQMKGVIGYYIAGAILVFATTNILNVAYTVIEGMDTNHNWLMSTQAATCSTPGYVRRTCTKPGCGKVLEEIIPATGHNYGNWTTAPATCTNAGSKYRTCSKCGGSDTQVLAATGHNYPDWTIITQATCTTSGSKSRTCQNPGCTNKETQTIAAGHDYKTVQVFAQATCTTMGTETQTCQKCGDSKTVTTSALGHHFNSSWRVTKEAECEKTGIEENYCVKCGNVQKTIAVKGHNYVADGSHPKPNALCGTKTHYKSSTCSRCGKQSLTLESCDMSWGKCRKCCQKKNKCDECD